MHKAVMIAVATFLALMLMNAIDERKVEAKIPALPKVHERVRSWK